MNQQLWGVNVVRVTPARNEVAYWQLVGRDQTGWSSRMGELAGIEGIRPSRRLELLPYLASDLRSVSALDRSNPFAEARTTNVRVGGDLKMGIGPDFTLDATFNPDFGQVEADPAEVNLSAYETFFAERRPFFLEGTQLLSARGNFYSRRIGAPPTRPNSSYSEAIDHTSILGAAKITGRSAGGLSVAGLTAVTAHEAAETYDAATRTFGRADVAPTTAYAVGAMQQEFGNATKTSSVAYALVTQVERDLERGSDLADVLARRAHSGIVDYRIRWRGGQYDLSAFVSWSYLQGDTAAMLSQQLSSRRYYQRPDADHVSVRCARDLAVRHVPGHQSQQAERASTGCGISTISRRRRATSSNDVGRLGSRQWPWRGQLPSLSGEHAQGLVPQLRDGRRADLGVEFWRYPPVHDSAAVQWCTAAQLLAVQSLVGPGHARAEPQLHARRSAHGHRSVPGAGSRSEQPRGLAHALASQPVRVARRAGWLVSFGKRRHFGATRDAAGGFTRSSPEPECELAPVHHGRQWRSIETFNRRYVFSYVERSELAARLRVNYAVTPELTVETYAEPFASSGRFFDFGELLAARSRDLLQYGTGGTAISAPDSLGRRTVQAGASSFSINNNDFNVRSFRSNVVVRWEWRPGSTVFLVWQQDRGSRVSSGERIQAGDVFDGLKAAGNNYFALKLNYWLPVR